MRKQQRPRLGPWHDGVAFDFATTCWAAEATWTALLAAARPGTGRMRVLAWKQRSAKPKNVATSKA
eukprot:12502340-Alexandrium_andersonii.AAC.1